MRTHISKSLQVRCKTLKRAIEEHNKAAACLTPPKPPVDWSKVSTYEFLEQVALLRDTHNSLQDKRWSNPGVRETLKLVERVERAKEELLRLNNEVRSLHTAIRDDDMLFTTTITSLPVSDPLRGAVSDFAFRRRLLDRQILVRIYQIYSLPGFTGTKGPGVRLGSIAPAPTASVPGTTSMPPVPSVSQPTSMDGPPVDGGGNGVRTPLAGVDTTSSMHADAEGVEHHPDTSEDDGIAARSAVQVPGKSLLYETIIIASLHC